MSGDESTCGVPTQLTLNGRVLDRRSFLCVLSLTATAVTAASTLAGGNLWKASPGEIGAWHVDDMWGHMPRYAHPISCRVVHVPTNLDNVHPIDHAFVA